MKKVGIAGAGGIGSNVAMHLVRSGVTCLRIVDFDTVSASNLNRQFYFKDQVGRIKVEALKENLERISPGLCLEMLNLKLDETNIMDALGDCDIIVEAFDQAAAKAMLAEAFWNSGRTVFSASGIAGIRADSVCIKTVKKGFTIVGDHSTDIADRRVFSPKVNVTAGLMAALVLEELGYEDTL